MNYFTIFNKFLLFLNLLWENKKSIQKIDKNKKCLYNLCVKYLSLINKKMKKSFKNMCEKMGLYKSENERTKAQKAIRDVTFFAVVIYAATITLLYVDAVSQTVELECDSYSQPITTQVALNQ